MRTLLELTSETSTATSRRISFKQNGNSTVCTDLVLRSNERLSFNSILETLNSKLGFHLNDISKLRLFNIEGMELYEEDLRFLKEGEVVYVSKGDDFNFQTYYSEYSIVRLLGQGGFGKVQLAVHKKTKQKVAIKITSIGGVHSTEEDSLAEAETVKSLNHPNIVKVLNFFIIKKLLQSYIIMEYLEGGELLNYIQEKKTLSEEDARTIFKQIVSAIDYCHKQKIIHRDLKVENIMRVSQDSLEVKVVDFGVSGLFAGRKSEVTKAGSLLYMAPELLIKANMIAAPEHDIWAMGCILYYMVVGKPPFEDKTSFGLIKKICETPLEFPKTLKLSVELIDLVSHLLIKTPEKRITMIELKQHPWILGIKM